MGKRKSEEEVIRSKIKKLKTELQRRTSCRSRIIYSSDSSEADDDFIVNSEAQEEQRSSSHDHVESPRLAASPPLTPVPDALQEASPQPSTHQKPQRPASALPGPSSAPDLPKTSPQVPPSSPDDQELDDDVLLMLGDAPQPETALGDNIHKDVASRWRDILLKGLQKEVKEKLFQEYPVPSNCDLLVAPTLNPEAKAALIENLVKRDHSLMQKQKQIGVALSALAQALDLLLKQDASKQTILKSVSDACRILCDSHYLETKTRRYFVVSSINTDLKDTLTNTVRDGFLFGENISDKLKAAQSIQKSGDTLKNTPKPFNNRFNKNNFVLNKTKPQKNNLNFKPPRPSRPFSTRRRASPQPCRGYRGHRR
ncbi:hypothetical protein MSG28_007445 [Choristoneura fumiferana]|uniref:Uncharacterized protein n=1 Tax=Choristoneura fumiferana TaxID=7141 RepID=A0ACC0JX64_CHOFU|nr:hypothetical protein MSG28_007445 [Choristoneura fumiferana]